MTTTVEPPVSIDAEQSVIGAALQSPDAVLNAYLGEVQLSPQHFYLPRHQLIWSAIEEMHDAGHAIDVLTVTAHLDATGRLQEAGGANEIDAFAAAVPSVGNLRRYGQIVRGHATARQVLAATYEIQAGIAHREVTPDQLAAWAESKLALIDGPATGGAYYGPEQLTESLLDELQKGTGRRWRWPLAQLNEMSGGGARPGQMTFIGGPSSHGKSAFVDQCMHSMGEDGANVAVFLVEMTPEERRERTAARVADVKYSRIQDATAGRGKLTRDEMAAIADKMSKQPVAFVKSPGWSATQIIREARRRRFDAIAIDLVQGFPTDPALKRHGTIEREVQLLDAFAKDTGCHVVLVGHVNRVRVSYDGTWPIPGLGDIRDSAELANRPDNVLFVWREQDPDTLDPIETGLIRVAKYRGAKLDSIKVEFDGEFQRFRQAPLWREDRS